MAGKDLEGVSRDPTYAISRNLLYRMRKNTKNLQQYGW